MCTLLTVDATTWETHRKALIRRIARDFQQNGDGLSLLLTSQGEPTLQLRCFTPALLLGVLRQAAWDRMYLHQRFATQGAKALASAHGWATEEGTFVMHNGCLRHPDALGHEVDSQAILQWLNEGGDRATLEHLRSEPFANVFLIDTLNGDYTVHRSSTGSLVTDDRGNYSTYEIPEAGIINEVDAGWYRFYREELVEAETYPAPAASVYEGTWRDGPLDPWAPLSTDDELLQDYLRRMGRTGT
jgi:hypothetical protein